MSLPKLHKKYLEQSFLCGTNKRPWQSSGGVIAGGRTASISTVSSISGSESVDDEVGGK